MKLLDIMKKYDRCLVRESAKLTKIYNMLLKEAADDGVDLDEMDLDEEKCPDCGKDPCVCDEEDKACDECGLIPEEDFIKDDEVKENDMLRNRPHNGHIDDPAGIIPESESFAETATEDQPDALAEDQSNKKKNKPNDDDGLVSAAEFFAEAEKEQKKDDIIPESEFFNEAEDDNFQNAEEFFNGKNAEVPPKSKDEPKKKAEKPLDEQELNFIPAEEWIQQAQEANLEESLKSYRRANHHLFND